MALAGVHICFGYANGGPVPQTGPSGTLLPYSAKSSQTMASPATSTISAPIGQPLLSISASAPIFYAVGPNPDATNGPRRYYDPTFGREDILVNVGDKFAWILA